MEVTSNAKALLAACDLASSAASDGKVIPTLRCLKLTARDERVVVEGTNNTIGLSTEVRSVTITKPGVCLVDATLLVGCLKESKDDIVLSSSPEGVQIGKTFRVPFADPDAHPGVAAFPSDVVTIVPAHRLRRLMAAAEPAVSNHDGKYGPTSGLVLDLGPSGLLKCVGFDERQLAVAADTGFPLNQRHKEVILPHTTVKLVMALLKDQGTEEVKIGMDRGGFFLSCGNSVLTSRIIDGRFPPYESVIPPRYQLVWHLPIAEVRAAARRASLLSGSKETATISLNLDGEKLAVTCAGGSGSLYQEDFVVAPVAMTGEHKAELDFDCRFFKDALDSIASSMAEDDKVELSLAKRKDGHWMACLRNSNVHYFLATITGRQAA